MSAEQRTRKPRWYRTVCSECGWTPHMMMLCYSQPLNVVCDRCIQKHGIPVGDLPPATEAGTKGGEREDPDA